MIMDAASLLFIRSSPDFVDSKRGAPGIDGINVRELNTSCLSGKSNASKEQTQAACELPAKAAGSNKRMGIPGIWAQP